MLSFQLKKPNSERLLGNVQAALQPIYGDRVWGTVQPFLQGFEEARARMVEASTAAAVEESVLPRLGFYFAYLKAIEQNLPAKHFRVEFTWTDSLSKKATMREASYAIEETCVMFNLGAAYSKLGANSDMNTPAGLKAALNYFLTGAGCFEQAKQEAAQLSSQRTIDLTNEYLSLASNILLAQSYFCMYQYVDKASYSRLNLSKLTASISRHFGNAYELSSREPLSQALGSDYAAYIKFQQMYFKAASRYWYCFVDKEEAEKKGSGYGKVVGRLKSADELLQSAYKVQGLRANMVEHSREMQNMIAAEIKTSMHVLTTIYVEPVVPGDTLPDPEEIANLKPKYPPPATVFNLEERLPGQESLLVLVPPQVLSWQNEYKEKLTEQFNAANMEYANGGGNARARLSAWGLPHKLDVLKNTAQKISEELWLKVQDVQNRRGVQGVIERLDAINLASQKVTKQIETTEKMMQEEAAEDEKMRKMYGDRWTRAPSGEVLRALSEELYRYKTKAAQADKVNQDLRNKLTQRAQQMALLEKSKGELDALTPSSLAGVIDSGSPVVERLNASLQRVAAIEKEVDALCNDWHRAIDADIITEELMEVYRNQTGKDAVLAAHLQQYAPKVQALTELNARMQQALSEVDASSQAFDKIVSRSGPDPKMEYFKQLEETVQVFNEVAKGVQQGADFYRQLEQRCVENTGKISNTVFARNSEKQELLVKVSSAPAKPAAAKPGAAQPVAPPPSTYGQAAPPQGGYPQAYPQGYPPASAYPAPSFSLPAAYPAAYPGAPQYPPQPYGQYPPAYPGAVPYGQPQGYPPAPYGYPPGQPGQAPPGQYPPGYQGYPGAYPYQRK